MVLISSYVLCSYPCKVVNKARSEGLVPAVCFVLPPPNQEAIQMAERYRVVSFVVIVQCSSCH